MDDTGKLSLHLPEKLQECIFKDAAASGETIPYTIVKRLCAYFRLPLKLKRRKMKRLVIPKTPRVTLLLSKPLARAVKLEQRKKKLVSISATLQVLLTKLYGLPLEVLAARKLRGKDWRNNYTRKK